MKVFPSEAGSTFDLYEDDGKTIGYKSGESRITKISQKKSATGVEVNIDKATGNFNNDESRPVLLKVASDVTAKTVKTGDKEVKNLKNMAELNKASEGWIFENGMITVKVASGSVGEAKAISIQL